MSESDPLEGLPADLAAILRDQSVIVPQDARVFELIAKWANAPSNTASAHLPQAPMSELLTAERLAEIREWRDWWASGDRAGYVTGAMDDLLGHIDALTAGPSTTKGESDAHPAAEPEDRRVGTSEADAGAVDVEGLAVPADHAVAAGPVVLSATDTEHVREALMACPDCGDRGVITETIDRGPDDPPEYEVVECGCIAERAEALALLDQAEKHLSFTGEIGEKLSRETRGR